MFPYKAENFDGNENLAIFINFLIYTTFLLLVPIILILIISIVKPRIKNSSNIYLYAFSAAMLIMIGTVGFIREAFEKSENEISNNESLNSIANNSEFLEQILTAGLVAGGAIVGLILIFVARFMFIRFFGETHSNHKNHDHHDHMISFTDIDNPKAAWLAILLLLSHRTIDGFFLGATIGQLTRGEKPINIGLVITFVLHIVVEILIIYYRQIQYGQTVKKAMFYNLLTTVLLIPIMLISAYMSRYLEKIGWILPIINASGGAIITFVAIIELVPEFIHLRSGKKKHWYIALGCFAAGIIFSLILLSFHSHHEKEIVNDIDLHSLRILLKN